MGNKDFIVYLSSGCEDRLRHSHTIQRGRLTRFCVQYEAWIADEWTPIVRYDTAHGRSHKDLLHPDKTQSREELRGYSVEDVMVLGERDITDYLRPDRTNQSISKKDFQSAYVLVPLSGTMVVQHLRGPSYLYAILMDARIRQDDW
jgi:hypothetical protein